MYYAAGETEKGDTFMEKLVKNACDKVEYYGNMKPKFAMYYHDVIEEQLTLLRQMQLTAERYDRKALEKQTGDLLDEYVRKYYMYD